METTGMVNNDSQKPRISIPTFVVNQPAWLRLEDQLKWYGSASRKCQNMYKKLKIAQVALAALIPVMSLLPEGPAKLSMALSGAAIAVLEAIQHMNQYATYWVQYRSTAERLKHEKFLFLSVAGPYRELTEPERVTLLSERVEEHVSTEHALWVSETKKTAVPGEREGK